MTDAQAIRQAHRDYVESQVLSAQPVEIVHLLYQVAMDNLNAAIAHLKNRDAFARSTAVTKAEMAVDELLLALDHSVGAPFTRTLAGLYDYVLQQIIKGHARQSEQAFREALSILSILASAWAEVKATVVADPPPAPAPPTPSVSEPQGKGDPAGAYSWGPAAAPGSRDWSG
jgi:flagellar secretion chaperone FliS